jgi:hypothetical protein
MVNSPGPIGNSFGRVNVALDVSPRKRKTCFLFVY